MRTDKQRFHLSGGGQKSVASCSGFTFKSERRSPASAFLSLLPSSCPTSCTSHKPWGPRCTCTLSTSRRSLVASSYWSHSRDRDVTFIVWRRIHSLLFVVVYTLSPFVLDISFHFVQLLPKHPTRSEVQHTLIARAEMKKEETSNQ